MSNFDFTRSAESETALRKILLPPKIMNCRDGLVLRSSGAAGSTLQLRIKPKTRAAILNLDTPTDVTFRSINNQYRESVEAIRWDEGFIPMGAENEARLGVAVLVRNELLER